MNWSLSDPSPTFELEVQDVDLAFQKKKQNKILCNGFYAFVSKAETPVGSVGATFMTTNTVKVQGEALRCVSGLC